MTGGLPTPPGVLDRLALMNGGLDPGLNKHDRVSVLIPVCIIEGITEGTLIRQALTEVGYDARHVGLTLSKGSASMPPDQRWYKDADGYYRLP
ncbi:hypothetical protein [Erythrobacter sp.]|uniref:hypothetical protein n=1 Tax=Erythrobacter sp. TaxID=1042 RepID=UPI0025E6471C|nr:hypothetical protein [Erythrobacter sp.]